MLSLDVTLSHFEMSGGVNKNIYLYIFICDEVAGLGRKNIMFYLDSLA